MNVAPMDVVARLVALILWVAFIAAVIKVLCWVKVDELVKVRRIHYHSSTKCAAFCTYFLLCQWYNEFNAKNTFNCPITL